MRSEKLELTLEATRSRDIIRVHPSHVGRPSVLEAFVQARGDAAVLRATQHDDARVLESRHDVAARIRRAVIHDQELKILERLSDDTANRLREVLLGVIYRHDHTDEGHNNPCCTTESAHLRSWRANWLAASNVAWNSSSCYTQGLTDAEGERLVIAFLVLAHERPGRLLELITQLAVEDNHVFVHVDAKYRRALAELPQLLSGDVRARVTFVESLRVDWGEFSMVRATLRMLECVERQGLTPSHAYLASGADFLIKPVEQLQAFLSKHDLDFIDSNRWNLPRITADKKERYSRYFYFNHRSANFWFNRLLSLQRRLGIERELPADIVPHFGLQWWALRWQTCLELLRWLRLRPDITRFFATTFIPDEMFFQSIVEKISPSTIAGVSPTLVMWVPSGEPQAFDDRHIQMLAARPEFLARKLHAEAWRLRDWTQRVSAERGAERGSRSLEAHIRRRECEPT